MLNKTIMAVGAHADDIEINIGGTCLKYRDCGYEFLYVMSTNNMSGKFHILEADGSVTYKTLPTDEFIKRRQGECAEAAKLLGASPIHLNYPQRHYSIEHGMPVMAGYGVPEPAGVPAGSDTILTAYEKNENVQSLAAMILEHRPEVIITHQPITVASEHFATCMLVTKACKAAAAQGYDGMLLYWLDSYSNFFGTAYCQLQTFIDVSSEWSRKLDFIRCHKSMIPVPERIEYMDFGSNCGCSRAEAFNIGFNGNGKLPAGASISAEIIRNFNYLTRRAT